jgi:hypothetical protein
MTIQDLLTSSGFRMERIVAELAPRSALIDRPTLEFFGIEPGWTFNSSAFPVLDSPR